MPKRTKGLGRGWWFESERHRLARMGIKTGRKTKDVLPKRASISTKYKEWAHITHFPPEFLEDFESEYGEIKDIYLSTYENGFEIETHEGTFLVFPDYDSAKQEAKEYIRDMLESEPELFNKVFLEAHTYISDTDKRMIATEEANNYVEGLTDRELLDEAGIDPNDYSDWDTAVDRAREIVEEDIYDKWYNGLSEDPVSFLCDEVGYYSRSEVLKQPFIRIDIGEAVEDAIATDGVAHFLATYDGKERELDGHYIYWIN